MLVAASVCPHPPLLLPEVSVTAPQWLDDLRSACAASVERLLSHSLDVVVAVGHASEAAEWDGSAGGTLRTYGVDARAGGAEAVLPLALTTAARLLDDARWSGGRRYLGLAADTSAHDCAQIGRDLVAGPKRVGLLVMGDGSAKRTTEAPGYYDERAGLHDHGVAEALKAADAAALLALSPDLADELWVAGRAAWQVLAGARATVSSITTSVGYDAAPRGVGYLVVDWEVAQADRADQADR